MKKLLGMLLGLFLTVGVCKAENHLEQVWYADGKIYAQATLSSPLMPNHILTSKVRLLTKSGVALTAWIPKTTNGTTNNNKISIPLPGPGDYKMEALYSTVCPSGKYYYAPQTTPYFVLWKIGYSYNCLYLVPGTESYNGSFYTGKYAKILGCNPRCPVSDGRVFTTPKESGHADPYVGIRYSWLEVVGIFRVCLDWIEWDRNKCNQLTGCGDFSY